MRPPLSRWRRFAVAGVALFTLVGTAACGSDDDTADTPAAAGSTEAEDSFPVSIEHKYGTTEIPAKPTKVVVTGLTEQDAMLALGTVPIATTEWFGGKPGAIWPWAEQALGSGARPTVLSNTDGIQFEKINDLDPDLIVSLYSDLSQQDYTTLAQIAPTVTMPEGTNNFGISWQDSTRIVGKALGRSAAADKLVTDTEATLAQVKTDHPEFTGTGLMVTNYEGIFVYGPQDPRSRLMESFGFSLPSGLAEVTGTEFGKSLSRERTDLLDVDALVWLVDKYDTAKANAAKNPLYSALAVSKEGRDIFIEDGETLGSATSFITVLSLPYIVDNLVPQLVQAVDGNPATAVERAS
jgi:iron complex transport system substrate-binding protein